MRFLQGLQNKKKTIVIGVTPRFTIRVTKAKGGNKYDEKNN